MSKEFVVTLKRNVSASAKACFEAWLNPDTLGAFLSSCEGMGKANAEVDPKEGGAFLIVMRAGEKEIPHRGHYKTIKPYEKIEFTWLSEFQKLSDSLVTLEFKAIDDNHTEFTLTHVGFESEQARNGHEGGWKVCVDGFVNFISK